MTSQSASLAVIVSNNFSVDGGRLESVAIHHDDIGA